MENELTLNQEIVGVSFNPSNNPRVDLVKQKFAEILDIIQEDVTEASGKFYLETSPEIRKEKEKLENLRQSFHRIAFDQLVLTQMAAVKVLTWKK